MAEIISGDKRQEIAQFSQSFIASAPCIIISVLDKIAPTKWLWMWYYEAGASAYNILLEATAWNLSANIISSLDNNALLSLLGLDNNYIPFFIVPVGKEKELEDATPPHVIINRPREGYLYVFNKEIMPIGRTILLGSCTAVVEAYDDYALQVVKFFVDGKAINETCTPPYECVMPSSFLPRMHVMDVVAYDYMENVATASLDYIKIL